MFLGDVILGTGLQKGEDELGDKDCGRYETKVRHLNLTSVLDFQG